MEAGQTLGHYRLLEPLGEGGFGRVWRAVDLRLERHVAIKVLKGSSAEHQRLLVQEARTASQLHHPNIATLFDVGEIDGLTYLAMELVEGHSLKHHLGRPLPSDLLQALAAQATSALWTAHQKGIVHRDIKPENLMLTSDGQLKILDFGVAKRGLTTDDDTHGALTQTGLTDMGLTTGTPAYMSPEQARNQEVGPASDQFSLGIVLWELAAGHHPFRRGAIFETLHAIAKEDTPTLARERPDLPPAFLNALHRMLAKAPGDRFPTLREAKEALERPATGAWTAPVLPLADGGPRPVSRPVLAWIAAGVAAAGLLAWGAWSFRSSASPGLPEPDKGGRRVIAILPLELLGEEPGQAWMGTSFADAMATGLLGQKDLLVLDRARVLDAYLRSGQKPGEAVRGVESLVKELKADLLLLGSCRGEGDQLRLSLRLVDGATGAMVRQAQIAGTRANLLGLEEQLSQRLPTLLGLRRESRDVAAASRAKDPRTREWYAKASAEVVKGTPDAYEAAQVLFQKALAGEPDYAPARAGLAWAQLELAATQIHLGRRASFQGLSEQAEAEARRALALDPSLASAHRVLAWASLRRSDFQAARAEGRRALELDPGDFRNHIVLGDAEAYDDQPEGRERAREHFHQALDLGPGDWFGHLRYGVFLQNEGDLREAIAQADQATALQPTAEYAHLCAAVSRLWLGETGEARDRAEAGLRQVPGSKLLRVTLALACHALGDRAGFDAAVEPLKGAWPEDHVITVLLGGMAADLDGRPAEMASTFETFRAKALRENWAARPTGDRRAVSVNLYHMARALALRGLKAQAKPLLDLSEKLHPGKAKVARLDPVFR